MNIGKKVLKLISLHGKTAMVTGGSSGIGQASAVRLAQAGASVAILDIEKAGGRRTAKKILRLGRKALFYPCDVTSDSECRDTVNVRRLSAGKPRGGCEVARAEAGPGEFHAITAGDHAPILRRIASHDHADLPFVGSATDLPGEFACVL